MTGSIERRFVDGKWQTVYEGTEGNGGSQPDPSTLGRAIYDLASAASNVPTTTERALAFALSSGDALLDLADPLHPTFVQAAVYVVAATVNFQVPQPADTMLKVRLEMDENGEDAEAIMMCEVGGSDAAYVTTTLAYFVPASGVMSLYATHNNPVSQTFGLNVVIQQVA